MPFHGPVHVIAHVLRKIGVDPHARISEFCQDPEYTACRAEELPLYFGLYLATSDSDERDLLCCFLLEGLNDFCTTGQPHHLQPRILDALFAAADAHTEELEYWMDTSDPDPENWWPISEFLAEHRQRLDQRNCKT